MYENFTLSGFSDEISPDIKKQFEGLSRLGIKHFEIRGVDGESVADITLEKAREVKALADSYGIKVSSVGSPIGKILITDPIEPHLDVLKHIIKIAKIFETKYIRMFSFFIPEGASESYAEYKDEVIERIKKMVAIAEEEDIILLHENEKGIYGDIAPRCREILDAVDSENLKAVFDPANFVQCGQATYPDAYKLLSDKVVYMHIKDAVGMNVVPAGEGDGHVFEILKELKAKNYKGFLSLEPHLAPFDGLDKLEASGNASEISGDTAGFASFKRAYDALCTLVNKL